MLLGWCVTILRLNNLITKTNKLSQLSVTFIIPDLYDYVPA